MKASLISIFLMYSVSLSAQVTFEKGYFINKSNERTECLIKDLGWLDNPTEFDYKLSESAISLKGTLEDVIEFGVPGRFKYIKVKTRIDQSSKDLKSISFDANPVWLDKTIFLKVLIESKLSLYSYKQGQSVRFFIKNEIQPIEQLVYKGYYVQHPKFGTVLTNNEQYKQQLWNLPKCGDVNHETIKNLRYSETALISFLNTYNKCHNENINVIQNQRDKWFFVRVGLGVSYNNKIEQRSFTTSPQYILTLSPTISPRIGTEVEVVMPTRRNKVSLMMELYYSSYSNSKSIKQNSVTIATSSINIAYIEPSFGIRYTSFLKPKAKLYFNFLVTPPIPIFLKNEAIFLPMDISKNKWFTYTASIGTGLTINKFSMELRYLAPRDITDFVETQLVRTNLTFLYLLN